MQGTLAPGEAIEIVLRIWVDGGENGSAMLLTSTAGGKLDAILVLRVEDGNDIFCSVNGVYLPSFFGLPLNLLAALPRFFTPPYGKALGLPSLSEQVLFRNSVMILRAAAQCSPGRIHGCLQGDLHLT